MNKFDELSEWMSGLFRFISKEKVLLVVDDQGEGTDKSYEHRKKYRFYTDNNVYALACVDRGEGKSYLGCTVSSRKPRAGESWTRGRDLADGPFSHNTWLRIVHDIVAYELVGLAERKLPIVKVPE